MEFRGSKRSVQCSEDILADRDKVLILGTASAGGILSLRRARAIFVQYRLCFIQEQQNINYFPSQTFYPHCSEDREVPSP